MIDYLIVGAGIIGLTLAKTLKEKYPNSNIYLLEKESEVGIHSSGRNSGVLHAGFYYTANSLKAKFTKNGNAKMTQFCKENHLKLNPCQKVVVAQNESELLGLEELKKRGDANGVDLRWISVDELKDFAPKAKTYKKALLSPTTATIDPKEICDFLALHVEKLGVKIIYNAKYKSRLTPNKINTTKGDFEFKKLINTAGLYADKIAHDFEIGKNYTIIPFKGIYLKDSKNIGKLNTNIYPVPNLANPFLGVHYTYSVKNEAKIGPTAIPAFWRENYGGFKNFSFFEFANILYFEALLFAKNSFGFRDLAISEIKKYNKKYFLNLAKKLTQNYNHEFYTSWSTPGIRAQLLEKNNLQLVQDFVVKTDKTSVHVLNAVSPAFTCSFAFSKWLVDTHIN